MQLAVVSDAGDCFRNFNGASRTIVSCLEEVGMDVAQFIRLGLECRAKRLH
jgi:hypothetical protein